MECRREENSKHCPCAYTGCEKHGLCCVCLDYHRAMGEVPGCYYKLNFPIMLLKWMKRMVVNSWRNRKRDTH